jgi:hypothetical protein
MTCEIWRLEYRHHYLNNGCWVLILSHLTNEGMNNVAECNRSCRDARTNKSLDQTRTGTIVCSRNTTINSILNGIVTKAWNNVFTGNRTHLRIESAARIRLGDQSWTEAKQARLDQVLSLDLSYSSASVRDRLMDTGPVIPLFQMFPNMKTIDLSFVEGYFVGELLRAAVRHDSGDVEQCELRLLYEWE